MVTRPDWKKIDVILDELSGDDEDTRREVRALLFELEREDGPLDEGLKVLADGFFDDAVVRASVEGRRIGPYRIVRELGHGGMGEESPQTLAALDDLNDVRNAAP